MCNTVAAPLSCPPARLPRRPARRCAWLVALSALALATGAWAGAPRAKSAPPPDTADWVFHSFIPLGFEPFQLQPSGRLMTVMATAESPSFEGWRRILRDNRHLLLDARNQPVTHFPEAVDFRVTASTRPTRAAVYDKPTALPVNLEPNALLLGLHFRLKLFHGLDAREIKPAGVRNLGVPPDVPYDERIYLVSFDLKDVSADDRLVLEVFTPDGQRVCRFHLELL